MADDLARWLAGEPVAARPASTYQRAAKWVRRRPAVAGLVATGCIAALLLVALAVGLVYQSRLRAEFGRAELARRASERAQADADQARRNEARQHGKTQAALAEVETARRATTAALGRSETFAYLAQIAWAEREYRAGDHGRAEAILDECSPEQRRWEWHHLKRLCRAELFAVATGRGLRVLSRGPQGRYFVTAGPGGALRASAEADGRVTEEFPPLPPNDAMTAVALSPDGRCVAVWSTTGPAKVWRRSADSAWGAAEVLPDSGGYVSGTVTANNVTTGVACAFSPDGRWLAAAGADRVVRVWDAATLERKFALPGHAEPVNGLAFSPDGQRLASCSGQPATPTPVARETPARPGVIKMWDLNGGAKAFTFGGGAGVIWGVTFLSATRLASAGGDGVVGIWDVEQLGRGRLVRTLSPGHAGAVLAVAASPDGDRLASAGADRTVRVWRADSGEQLHVHRGHATAVHAVAFLTAGERVVSVGDDGARVWGRTATTDARTLAGTYDVAFSPDGSRVAADDRGVSLWDLAADREVWRATDVGSAGHGRRLAFSPDGTRLAVSHGGQAGGVLVLDAGTGRRVLALKGEGNATVPVAFSPDGRWVAAASIMEPQGTVVVWDAASGAVVRRLTAPDAGTEKKRPHAVYDIAFSPDGRWLATAGGDRADSAPVEGSGGRPGDVRVWDLAPGGGARTFAGARFCCWAVAFSPDGRWLAAGGGLYRGAPETGRYLGPGGEVRAWDVATGREAFAADRRDCIFRVAFSPDGSRLACAGGVGRLPAANEVTLSDTTVWRDVLRLTGHKGAVHGLAFSRDGRTLASVGGNEVKIWGAPPVTSAATQPATQPSTRPATLPAAEPSLRSATEPSAAARRPGLGTPRQRRDGWHPGKQLCQRNDDVQAPRQAVADRDSPRPHSRGFPGAHRPTGGDAY